MPAKKHNQSIRPIIEEVQAPKSKTSETQPQIPAPNKHEEKAKQVIAELNGLKKNKSDEKMNLKLIFIITILTALIVGFVSGGVYVYLAGIKTLDKNTGEVEPTPVATPLLAPTAPPLPSATPEPKQELSLSKYKISIQNGSGKIGEAAKVQALLKNGGFTVTSVGNAPNYNYTETIVQFKKSVPTDLITQLKSVLSKNYSLKEDPTLKDAGQFDVVIIVGSK